MVKKKLCGASHEANQPKANSPEIFSLSSSTYKSPQLIFQQNNTQPTFALLLIRNGVSVASELAAILIYNMGKREELKSELKEIWHVLILSKQCFNYTLYFHKPDTQEELEYLNYSRDFRFIRHILWRMTVIELSKIFSKSKRRDKFNFVNLINKLRKNGYYSCLDFPSDILDRWVSDLNIHSNIIERLLTLRDKYYAHSDNLNEPLDIIILFDEIKELILLLENLITDINKIVFQTASRFEPLDNILIDFDLIKILSRDKKRKIEKLITGADST